MARRREESAPSSGIWVTDEEFRGFFVVTVLREEREAPPATLPGILEVGRNVMYCIVSCRRLLVPDAAGNVYLTVYTRGTHGPIISQRHRESLHDAGASA